LPRRCRRTFLVPGTGPETVEEEEEAEPEQTVFGLMDSQDRDGSSYNEGDWSVADHEGIEYDQAFIGAGPDLGTGDIRPNKNAQRWVTFEVPKNAKWLEVSQTGWFQDPLYGTLRIRKQASIRASRARLRAPTRRPRL
jgi:hypothetical protein